MQARVINNDLPPFACTKHAIKGVELLFIICLQVSGDTKWKIIETVSTLLLFYACSGDTRPYIY